LNGQQAPHPKPSDSRESEYGDARRSGSRVGVAHTTRHSPAVRAHTPCVTQCTQGDALGCRGARALAPARSVRVVLRRVTAVARCLVLSTRPHRRHVMTQRPRPHRTAHIASAERLPLAYLPSTAGISSHLSRPGPSKSTRAATLLMTASLSASSAMKPRLNMPMP